MPPKKAAASASARKSSAAKSTAPKSSVPKSSAAKSSAAKSSTAKSSATVVSSATGTAKKAPLKKSSSKAKSASATKTTKANTEKATSPSTKKSTRVSSPADSSSSSSRPKATAKGATAAAKKTSADKKKYAPALGAQANISKKRKLPDTEEEENSKAKKKKVAEAKVGSKPKPFPRDKAIKQKPRKVINVAPTNRLNVYVFGEGGQGELGLGAAKNAIDVKRPRLNPNLLPDVVGVVQIAVGGMHAAALTHDSKIYTWGVNDQHALGRDTLWEGGLRDIDDAEKEDGSSDSEDSEDESGLNPREATPAAIPDEAFPPGTKFVELAAGDSSTFALTDDGYVWGWGTFRSNEGILGFSQSVGIAETPVRVDELKDIIHIASGDNHCLALSKTGRVYSWGSGQQNQLGRRIIERTRTNGLIPREFGLPKDIVHIACGGYHSFAVSKAGSVYTWGSNNYGETGIAESAGQDNAVIFKPAVIKSLADKNITHIAGGAHHSLAITSAGECLVWGRVDGYQIGIKVDTLPEEDLIKDEKQHPRILTKPTPIPGLDAVYGCCGTDHSIAINKEGQAYSWGFSTNYQTGLGTTNDIEVATLINNTAVKDQKLVWAGAGGQFSMLASVVS